MTSHPASNFFRAQSLRRAFSPRVAVVFLLAVLGTVAVPQVTAGEGAYDLEKRFTLKTGGEDRPTAVHVGNTDAVAGKEEDKKQTVPPVNLTPAVVSKIESNAVDGEANADATSTAVVDSFPKGGPVIGKVTVKGDANNDGKIKATSKADSKVIAHGQTTPTGSITSQIISNSDKLLKSTDTQAQIKANDPISFEMIDLNTDEIFKGTLLDFLMELDGTGSVIWDDGGIVVDAKNFSFNYTLSDVFVVNPGKIDFVVTNGFVTTSNATGRFSGLLPSLGSTGLFNIGLSEVAFDFNLGDHGGHNLSVDFTFGASGSAELPGVPEPGTMAAGLALVGLCLVHLRRRRK